MYEKCFYFLLTPRFSGKMVFLRKLKLIYPSTPAALEQLFSPYLFNFIQKNVSPTPIQKRGQRLCSQCKRLERRDSKVGTILYDRFLIYRTVKS